MMVIHGIHVVMFVAVVQTIVIAAYTDHNDKFVLEALKNEWYNSLPQGWKREDPCTWWEGIECDYTGYVVSIAMASFNLSGTLPSDIGKLSELQLLDLSQNPNLIGPIPTEIGNLNSLQYLYLDNCGFNSGIPDSIGSLQQLATLALNGNRLINAIPASIGNLSSLSWLDLADNKLSGSIPVSNETSPGLDMLNGTAHFHLENNQLSGEIPSQLFGSNMSLLHLLLNGNKLNGSIPSTLGLMQKLEIMLDGNSLSGSVPGNIVNLINIKGLYLANNQLNGPLPDLSGMNNSLSYVDMSNNSFDSTDIPTWFPSLQSLSSLIMEKTQIRGTLPASLFRLPQLQEVVLKNNRVNGTLSLIIGSVPETLQLIDLQNNIITSVDPSVPDDNYDFKIILVGNPVCPDGGQPVSYCNISSQNSNPWQAIPKQNCTPSCNPALISSPTCKCSYPYTGILKFRAPSFSNYGNSTPFEALYENLLNTSLSLKLPVESFVLRNPTRTIDSNLLLTLQVFPSVLDYFNYTGISAVSSMLRFDKFKPPDVFGPYSFLADSYSYPPGVTANNKPNIGVIIGASAGGFAVVLLLILAGVYVFHRKAMVGGNAASPFASWDLKSTSGGVPQLKGTKSFSFEELKNCSNNFSDRNSIGSGGYGKVYRGILSNGQLVAIKRARQESTQGGLEFKTEIELLSRVHHKNVLGLIGFCIEQGEQMLVYDFIPNGSLKDSLSGKTGIRLDWIRRLRIIVGAARGLQYLHDLADPSIIHRDIKSSNILLDDHLSAKVADFGLSKLRGDSERGHVTTQVKGTMGYLDPEYYMTQQLTEKSDVYSFGVLMLEILSSRSPIEKGKYIVREVKQAMDTTKDLYDLQLILDPIVTSTTVPKSIEKFVDLALMCVEESGSSRPHMSQVVKGIEIIMELVGLNPNAESASTSSGYEGPSRGFDHPYSNESLLAHTAGYPLPMIQPK